jgi:hypothetical protein
MTKIRRTLILADLSLPLKGDHMKAFIDEEAEAEDGSDNDLMGFSDSSLSNDIVIYILARP